MTRDELAALGYELDEAALARLHAFAAALLAENEGVNLTGAKSAGDLWRAHLCDALALAQLLEADHTPVRLLDIGSGGGLPGLAVACVRPDVEVTTLDGTRKKIAAQERIVAALKLENARPVWGRAELLVRERAFAGRFDFVTARAVGDIAKLVEYAGGFLRPGGWAWLYKSAAQASNELAAARGELRRAGLVHVETLEYAAPAERAGCVLLGFEREVAGR